MATCQLQALQGCWLQEGLGDLNGDGLWNNWTYVWPTDNPNQRTCLAITEGGEPVPPPPPTDAQVAEVFLTLPLAVPDMKTNPPAPACTVINIDNTFYLDPPPADVQTVDILGTPVTIHPQIRDYTFTYGDGTTHTTTDPGAPYPDTTNTHTYTTPGIHTASVTVTWTGQWEAPGIPLGPIPGVAQTTSTPTVLYTHTYRTELLDDPDSAPAPGTPLDADDPCTR